MCIYVNNYINNTCTTSIQVVLSKSRVPQNPLLDHCFHTKIAIYVYNVIYIYTYHVTSVFIGSYWFNLYVSWLNQIITRSYTLCLTMFNASVGSPRLPCGLMGIGHHHRSNILERWKLINSNRK